MADSKITALAALTTADPANDMFPVVDVSDTSMAASGTTKRISINNILACSPSATLASATITGDLTVRTNQLIANANGVGVGTAPSAWSGIGPALQVEQASLLSESGNQLYLTANGYFAGGQWNYINNASADQYYQIAGSHVWRSGIGGAGGTAIGWSTLMTLNSTGLGVGRTPSYKLDVAGVGNFDQLRVAAANATKMDLVNTTSGLTYSLFSANTAANGFNGFAIFNGTDYDLRIVSGNVGIGVTPSAWTSAFGSVLQFKSAGSSAGGSLTGSSADNFRMFSNTYYDGAYKYIAAGFATQYEQSAGSHVWYLSGTTAGAINGAITFSTALSLDKTGSLVLGSAAVATTATDGFLYIPSCAGAPTGVPTTKTGRVPMVVDSTNNRFYVYVGGTWKYTTLA